MSQLNLNASNKIHLRIDKFICLNPPAAGKTKKKRREAKRSGRPARNRVHKTRGHKEKKNIIK